MALRGSYGFATFAWLADVFIGKRAQQETGRAIRIRIAGLRVSARTRTRTGFTRSSGCIRSQVERFMEICCRTFKTTTSANYGKGYETGRIMALRLLRKDSCGFAASSGCGIMAVTSRQNAGQTLAQVFPKFANHPSRNAALQRAEAKCCEAGRRVFLALPHGVAAEYAVPLMQAGCIVIDLSADFRVKSAEVYKEFYAHDHPAPELLGKIGLRIAGDLSRANQKGDADRVAGLLSDERFAADDSVAESGAGQIERHHCGFAERRERRGSQGRAGLSFRRMQRKRAALRRAEASASFGNRAGTFARRRTRR